VLLDKIYVAGVQYPAMIHFISQKQSFQGRVLGNFCSNCKGGNG